MKNHILKRTAAAAMAAVLFATTPSATAMGAQSDETKLAKETTLQENDKSLHFSYSFGTPEFEASDYGYRVLLDDATALNDAGMPDLPSKTISFLLPQGKTVESVQVLAGSKTVYEDMLIAPSVGFEKTTEYTDETVSVNEAEQENVSENTVSDTVTEVSEETENEVTTEVQTETETETESTEVPVQEETLEGASSQPEGETTLKATEVVKAKELMKELDFTNSDIYNQSIYLGETTYPNKTNSEGSVQTVRGFQVYTVTLYPMSYTGTTLTYTEEMSVDITLTDDDTEQEYVPTEEDLAFLGDDIDTSKYASTYFSSTASKSSKTGTTIAGKGKIDYIIITDNALAKTFKELADYKASKGLTTAVVTTQKIYKKYKGYDRAEKIRNFIKDAYSKNKVTYILLGGDGDNKTNSNQAVVPTRLLYCKEVASGEQPTYIASDVYYGCLDGTYDNNKNHKFGEEKDGVNGKDVDLLADVYVGRAPVDNKKEAKNFITKTINYETRQKKTQALMIGEKLSGNYECSVELAANLQNTMDANTLADTMRKLRDEKIKDEYVTLYYDVNDFMKNVYLSDLDLLAKTVSLLTEYTPIVMEYVDTNATQQVVEQADILCLQEYAKELSNAIANSKEEEPNKEKLLLELAYFEEYVGTCEGMTFAQMFEGSRFYEANKTATTDYDKLEDIFGGTYKDEIRLGSKANNMTTKGFPDNYKVETLYDKNSDNQQWTTEALLAKLNASPELINHLGHANVDSLMRLNVKQIQSLKNQNAFFFYSQGCYAGSFDNCSSEGKYSKTDSIAEELVVSSNKSGAFAVIANSRYGWYNSDPSSTKGPSQIFDRLFWDEALYAKDKSLGSILAKSRQSKDVLDNMNDESYGAVMRYCFYELTLLGDPETSLHDLNDPLLAQPKLTVKKASNGRKLTWNKVKSASKYIVYRSTSSKGEYKKIGTTKDGSFVDKKASKGKTYYYKVAAYKKSGSNVYYRVSNPKKSK